MKILEVLSQYSFFELWNPILIVMLGIILFIYLKAFHQDSPLLKGNTVSTKTKTYFVLFLVSVYITFGGPLPIIAKMYSFGAHMLQTSLLFLVVTPLFLLGTPNWFVRPFFLKVNQNSVFRTLNKPLVALFAFNVMWSFYHIPFVFDFMMEHMILMKVGKVFLLALAFFMWFQIIPPIEEMDHLSPIQKIGYIFADGMLITPACALIVFADHYFYTAFLNSPLMADPASRLADQKFGGAVMKIVQELSYGFFLWYAFYQWVNKDNKHKEIDPLPREVLE